MSLCSHCNQVAEESLSIRHRTCSHMTHVDCLSEPINYKLCGPCLSPASAAASGGGEAGKKALIGGPAAPAGGGGGGGEPHTTDGHNYILNPGKKPSSSVLKSLGSLLTASKQPTENIKTSQNPEFLLNNRVSIEQMMKQNKLGMDHLLKAGIVIEDFLKNQYDWTDLQKFEYVQKGGKRALQTLAIGLGVDANHLRDYSDQLPAKDICAHLKMEPAEFFKELGLEFPQHGPLMCNGDDRWSARDCVAMGLTIDDLMELGLQYTQQYADLMVGLTPQQVAVAEKKLQTKLEHLQQLVDAEAEQQSFPPPQAAERTEVAQPLPQKVTRHIPQRQQQQVIHEEYEEEAPPPQAAAVGQRVVIVEKPVYIEKQVIIKEVPPPAAAVISAKIHHTTPVARTPQYVQRGAAKFNRHGALIK